MDPNIDGFGRNAVAADDHSEGGQFQEIIIIKIEPARSVRLQFITEFILIRIRFDSICCVLFTRMCISILIALRRGPVAFVAACKCNDIARTKGHLVTEALAISVVAGRRVGLSSSDRTELSAHREWVLSAIAYTRRPMSRIEAPIPFETIMAFFIEKGLSTHTKISIQN